MHRLRFQRLTGDCVVFSAKGRKPARSSCCCRSLLAAGAYRNRWASHRWACRRKWASRRWGSRRLRRRRSRSQVHPPGSQINFTSLGVLGVFFMSWRAEFWSSGVMAAAPQPAMQMMQVACPAGVSAGQAIQVRPRGCSCRPPAQAAASPRLPALAAFSLFVSAAGCSFPPSSSERLVSRAWTLLQSGCCLQPAA